MTTYIPGKYLYSRNERCPRCGILSEPLIVRFEDPDNDFIRWPLWKCKSSNCEMIYRYRKSERCVSQEYIELWDKLLADKRAGGYIVNREENEDAEIVVFDGFMSLEYER